MGSYMGQAVQTWGQRKNQDTHSLIELQASTRAAQQSTETVTVSRRQASAACLAGHQQGSDKAKSMHHTPVECRCCLAWALSPALSHLPGSTGLALSASQVQQCCRQSLTVHWACSALPVASDE
jgi:hypothetical protein